MSRNDQTKTRRTGWRGYWATIAEDKGGFAAVEFAMVVPIMVVLFLGAVEFSLALSYDRRITAISSATADLVAQEEEVDSAYLDDVMQIANGLLPPDADISKLDIKLVSVVADADSNVTVAWSYNRTGGEPYAENSAYNDLPADLVEPLTSVVVAEVSYTYNPPVGHFITGDIGLSERFFLRPRKSLQVTKTD
ncbi:MAG: TadE/TadG family type IV pilus assembly protein [Hyphomicrobiaceae bacterium]